MVTREATICNEYGIHCRPSAVIAKEAQQYSAEIRIVTSDGCEGDVKNLMALLSLGITCGQRIRIEVSGEYEDSICARIVALFETNFDFPRD